MPIISIPWNLSFKTLTTFKLKQNIVDQFTHMNHLIVPGMIDIMKL